MAKKLAFRYTHSLSSPVSFALYKRLLRFVRPYWLGFFLATLGMVVVAASETAFPALMKPLLDQGFQGEQSFPTWWAPVAILVIFAVRGIAGFSSTYAMSWIANNVLRDLRSDMFNRLLTMPSASFDAKSSGQLISRVIAEVNGVTNAATNVVTTLVRDSLILVGLLGWLFWLNWQLSLVAIALVPALAALTVGFSSRMRKVSRGALKATGDMTRKVEQVIYGNRVIKIFQGQPYEQENFDRVNADYRSQSMRLVIAQALQTPLSQFLAAIGVAVVITIALLQTRAGEATVGGFVSFITAMLMTLAPLKRLADLNIHIQRGLAAAESVFALIDETTEEDSGSRRVARVQGSISFRNVGLIYPGESRTVLNDISLEINAGETVAFVGPSGGGKSSIVNLVPRLYEPTCGQVSIDQIPVREFSLANLRAQIALVSQDVILFNDTIFNNVAYGDPNAREDQVWGAIKAAGLDNFVAKLELRMQTKIGDRGLKLSGGQRQRLAIARAIMKDAPILILDEATSALDSITESEVQLAIDQLRKNRTTLIVAHRLSTVQNADRIVFISGGKILEQGSHEELLRLGGAYLKLFGRQGAPEENIDTLLTS
jgi:ATP-binding cassette, subfamily B, bacterial MsbA